MELPFAVESSVNPVGAPASHLQQSESSLVTASSQGSFMGSNHLDGLNTPQDVVLPRYENYRQPQPQIISTEPVPTTQTSDGFAEPEVTDFTYVNVFESDADGNVLIEGEEFGLDQELQRTDVLSLLLSGVDPLVAETESANEAARKALEAKKRGDILEALEYHTQAAKIYKNNATRNPTFAKSMLLLSQTQAKSALALKGIIKLNPAELLKALPSAEGEKDGANSQMTHKDRLRAAVRGALGSRHPHEADISDSQFLGSVKTTGPQSRTPKMDDESKEGSDEGETLLPGATEENHNPVDEMMELERELRDMDMALELGNSISSLDTRMQNRMKNSMVDGSFMVVPAGSNSYMSSSMWGATNTSNTRSTVPPNNIGTAGVRARANRVQTILEASSAPVTRPVAQPQTTIQPTGTKTTNGLESSWWGNSNSTSQILTSSVISLGSRVGVDGGPLGEGAGQPTNTKQLMRLMDSLKALGDENATLLREVEEAEAARNEAKAAREQMKRFKVEYGKRFAALKAALEKFRQDYSKGSDNAKPSKNPMNTSEFIRNASFTDQMQRQEQLIRKLTVDLKKEKEESKKKDAALRKYESFYREVKARSAQKAKQRELEQRQPKPHRNHASHTHH